MLNMLKFWKYFSRVLFIHKIKIELLGSAQRVNEKNRVICVAVLFTPGVMVNKMSKMAHSFNL